jgi:hypothetical protein
MAFAPPRAWKISPMTDDLIVTRDAAGVVRITLNRPGRLNALGVGLVDALITEVGRRTPICSSSAAQDGRFQRVPISRSGTG